MSVSLSRVSLRLITIVNHSLPIKISRALLLFVNVEVFGADGSTSSSAIINAIEWAVSQGAKVINLSLGADQYSKTAEKYFASIAAEGIISIAASGNSGTNALHYPASFPSVISVASVDKNLGRSYFSQTNAMVDIAAPGTNILSTVPLGITGAAAVIALNTQYIATILQNSPAPHGQISGKLHFCPSYGNVPCQTSGAYVCLIERGESSFETKALNCGGLAAIIYNNETGLITGSLATPTAVKIPVFTISQEDGTALVGAALGGTILIDGLNGCKFDLSSCSSFPFTIF
jgi:serine protease